MSMFTIAWKDIKIRLHDRKSFITLLLMPVVLTAILGTALGGVFDDEASLPDTTVGVVVMSADDMTNQFIETVLRGEALEESLTVKEFKTETKLKEALEQEKVDAGLVFPEKWGEGLLEGDGKPVKVIKDPAKNLQASILSSITESYVDRVTSVSIATAVVAKELSAMPVAAMDQDLDIAGTISGLSNNLSTIAESQVNAVTAEMDGKEPISGMQYYAAAMGAMFILFNTTIGAKTIVQERNTETLARLMSSPIRHSSIILGKFLGTLSFTFLQFIVFVFTTSLLFSVEWGSNIGQLLLIGFAYSVAVAGLAMSIAGVISEEKTADTLGGIGVQILAIIGGSMIPVSNFPTVLQQLSHIAPNKWVLDSFLDIMNGTSWNTLVLPVSVLMLCGMVTLLIGSVKLKVR